MITGKLPLHKKSWVSSQQQEEPCLEIAECKPCLIASFSHPVAVFGRLNHTRQEDKHEHAVKSLLRTPCRIWGYLGLEFLNKSHCRHNLMLFWYLKFVLHHQESGVIQASLLVMHPTSLPYVWMLSITSDLAWNSAYFQQKFFIFLYFEGAHIGTVSQKLTFWFY